jgi:ribosome assembly protein RRB1
MSKRTATELSSIDVDGQAFQKSSGSGPRRMINGNEGIGEFEDAWEDELESDEEIDNAAVEEEEGGVSLGSNTKLSQS